MICKTFLHITFVTAVLSLVFVNKVISAVAVDSPKNLTEVRYEYLKRSNFLISVLEEIVQGEGNSLCIKDATRLLDGIKAREIWAIKLFDSHGKIPSSINTGSTFWYPPRSECDTLNTPHNIFLTPRIERFNDPGLINSTSPVRLSYKIVHANYKTPYQVEVKLHIQQTLHIGLCTPQSCTTSELLEATRNTFDGTHLHMQELLNLTVEPFEIRTPQLTFDFLSQPPVKILGYFVAFITICSILASFSQVKPKSPDEKRTPDNSLLSCFNVRENAASLFSSDAPPGFITPIAGLKCLTCLWVTLVHLAYFMAFAYIDTINLLASFFEIVIVPCYISMYYVDTFFVISGFLLCYQFLKSEEQMKKIESNNLGSNVWLYVKTVVYRYCRLTPVYAVTVFLSDAAHTYVETVTPYYLGPKHDLYCRKTWSYNLLFINNFVKVDDMCHTVGWYLACEMQYFLLFLGLLILYAKNKKTAKVIFVFLIGLFLAVSYYCYYETQTIFLPDVMFSTGDQVYTKPWTRINPYIGGVLMGWIMYEIRNYDLKISSLCVRAYWLLCSAFFVASLFTFAFYNTPAWITAAFNSFGRLFLAFFIGSIIIMCHSGYGGGFNRFLSSKTFVYLYKLTYSIYLVTPPIVVFFTGNQTPVYANLIGVIVSSPSLLFYIYGASIALYIFVELPFFRLAKKLLK